ncbi:MAG TPA: DUF1080 domain-containing protein [Puia sp.]|nr:DUF1080 domain-containing protein [Puia sp.]
MKNTWFAMFAAAGLFVLAGWHSGDMAGVHALPDLSALSALPAADTTGWIQLFDGKDLNGWKHVGPGSMTVENGLIRGHGGMGLLYWTGGKLGNCKIKVVFKMRDMNDNSGVFIRIPIEPREEWMPVHYGYEVQIDNHPETSNEDEYHITGTLYSLTRPLAKPGKPGPEWNTMEITLDGPRTIVYVNGRKVTDYTEGQPVPARKFDFEPQRGRRPNSGWIGLQNHSDNDVVYFKEVAMKPLAKK